MDPQQHLKALERFDAMLKKPGSSEADWQRLFAECPYILSRALPLQLEPRQIVPLARPGKAEVDFAIHPDPLRPGSPRGLIELKRPDQRVLKFPREGIVSLYSEAHTAKRQVEEYATRYPWSPDTVLMLGDEVFKFVIMGLSRTWADAITSELLRTQLSGLFGGVRFFGYDQIFESYRATMPQRLLLLIPSGGGSPLATDDGLEAVRNEFRRFLPDARCHYRDGHAWFGFDYCSFANESQLLEAIEVVSRVPHNLASVSMSGHVPSDDDFWPVGICLYPRPSSEELDILLNTIRNS